MAQPTIEAPKLKINYVKGLRTDSEHLSGNDPVVVVKKAARAIGLLGDPSPERAVEAAHFADWLELANLDIPSLYHLELPQRVELVNQWARLTNGSAASKATKDQVRRWLSIVSEVQAKDYELRPGSDSIFNTLEPSLAYEITRRAGKTAPGRASNTKTPTKASVTQSSELAEPPEPPDPVTRKLAKWLGPHAASYDGLDPFNRAVLLEWYDRGYPLVDLNVQSRTAPTGDAGRSVMRLLDIDYTGKGKNDGFKNDGERAIFEQFKETLANHGRRWSEFLDEYAGGTTNHGVLIRASALRWFLDERPGLGKQGVTVAARVLNAAIDRAGKRWLQIRTTRMADERADLLATEQAAHTAGSELAAEDVNLYDDFVPHIFTPDSEEAVDEIVSEIGRKIVGRRLSTEELAKLKPLFRELERRRYKSSQELAKRQDVPDAVTRAVFDETAMNHLVEKQYLGRLQAGDFAVDHDPENAKKQILAAIKASADYKAARSYRSKPFTEFGDDEAAFELIDAAQAQLDPTEQAGVDLRTATEAFAKALSRGQG